MGPKGAQKGTNGYISPDQTSGGVAPQKTKRIKRNTRKKGHLLFQTNPKAHPVGHY